MSGGDGGSRVRVSIPAVLVKTIQNIREITGKQHSDEDIYSVFKDCLNDPHETAQKLMYLDTFQEVKSKRKKENFVPRTQERGRGGRRNFAPRYTDANNGRSAAFRKPTGANHIVGGSKTAVLAPNKAINNTAPNPIKAPKVTEETPLAKSTSSSENGADLEKSKASVVPVAVPVLDSNSSGQSVQVTRSEDAVKKVKNESHLQSDFGEQPHVTFPVHLKAAKLLEKGLSFGSFGSDIVKDTSSDNCTNWCNESSIESSHVTVASVASAREDVSTLSQDKNHEISNSAPKAELALQSDQTVHPVEGSEGDKLTEEAELALQSDQTVHSVEGSEGDKLTEEVLPITDTNQAANSDGPPISYPDHSMAASQQAMHPFMQQYPQNYFPYPYYPPYYMPPPYMHQYLNPNGFQQQSYLPPRDDAPTPPGTNLSLPDIKSGSNIGNSPPTTIPSPYDSYTAAAFNHFPSAPTVNSTHKEDKNENIYTNGPMSLANLQARAMYNLSLQGQPLAYPTAQPGFPGIYQQTPSALPGPTIFAMTENIGLPNQQPQAAALTNLGNNYLVKQSN
ncbi:hypothetical protein AALP_AA3G143200 [Arabis alpina]|uniref:GBF-interacting protein 1 N-terminal domain-containing protein n=1 Tax=Arabis alpina TaxID=50452 RepID=A0A087H954_ARAAL|nr:hypothetical protein AALP_AA3G143200 [Arabis alpina]